MLSESYTKLTLNRKTGLKDRFSVFRPLLRRQQKMFCDDYFPRFNCINTLNALST